MSSLVSRLFGSRKPRRGKRGPKYETAKQKAREKDPEARRKVAARTNVEPEILYYLAEDVDRRVRREIARNKAPPPHADVLLARDTDDEVRTDLARKIGRLAPRLSKREAGHLEQLTLEALEILARDTLHRVRAIIAEEIKRLDNIPKPLIDALARDVELIVAAPILEYSPLLNDDDLLKIISSKPVQGALSAIARREGLSESISDSIAAVFDVDAIARGAREHPAHDGSACPKGSREVLHGWKSTLCSDGYRRTDQPRPRHDSRRRRRWGHPPGA